MKKLILIFISLFISLSSFGETFLCSYSDGVIREYLKFERQDDDLHFYLQFSYAEDFSD